MTSTPEVLTCYDENSNVIAVYELGTVSGTQYVLRNDKPVMEEEAVSLNFEYDAYDGVVTMELEFKDDQENKVRVDSKANLRNRNISSL